MNKQFSSVAIIGIAVVIVLIIFGSSIFYKLEPAERAIIFRQFSTGLDKENVYQPGFHVIAPWNDFIVYDVTEQQREERMDVLDKSGLSVMMDITVRFTPQFESIGYLHEKFLGDYINKLVVPEVRSSVRKVTGRYTAEEIYSTKRNEVENSIIEETGIVLDTNFIQMKALLIRSINLPVNITKAIELKLTQEQEFLAYQYKLTKEESEAKRKVIEAEGIAKYNQIISSSLTDKILKQKGIDATLKLAESPNSKVVVVGSGKDGMPLILGNN